MIQKKKFPFVVVVVVLLIAGTAPTVAATGETPSICSYVAYTADYEQRHFSLLKNNSTLIGQTFIIEQSSNCSLDLVLNQGISFHLTGNNSLEIPLYTESIIITQNNISQTFSSLQIYPVGSMIYGDIIDLSQISGKTTDEVWWGEVISHLVTFLILYVLSTTVVYRVAKNRVDNSVEVVI